MILTAARTGSNALVDALLQHPEIHCDFEIFHSDQIYTAGDNPFDIALRDRDHNLFLTDCVRWSRERHPSAQAYGFKLFFGHSDRVYERVLADPTWKKILLHRSNMLDQCVSDEIARLSQKWTSNDGVSAVKKIELEMPQLEYRVQTNSRNFRMAEDFLEESEQAFLKLEYGDVVDGRFDKVCRFLGVDDIPLATSLKKQNSRRSADKISNVEQVKNWLRDNGHLDWWVE